MSLVLEHVYADLGSSFRVLHLNVMASVYKWNYHYHPEIELVFVYNGMGRRHVGSHVSYYQAGDLVMIGSELPHSGFGFGALAQHQEIVIQFKYEILGNALLSNIEFESIKDLIEKSKTGLAFNQEIRNTVQVHFENLLYLEGIERFWELIKLLKILSGCNEVEILNKSAQSYHLKDSIRISKIFYFIEKSFDQEIISQDVANLVNLTLPAFYLF